MILRRHPVLRIQNAAAVVLVVADDDRARLACVLADDDGRAADRIEGERAQRNADGCGDCLELHGHRILSIWWYFCFQLFWTLPKRLTAVERRLRHLL